MLRRIHLIVGLLGIAAFLLTGQLMKHHDPPTPGLATDVRMMYVSRHIYLLGQPSSIWRLGSIFTVDPLGGSGFFNGSALY